MKLLSTLKLTVTMTLLSVAPAFADVTLRYNCSIRDMSGQLHQLNGVRNLVPIGEGYFSLSSATFRNGGEASLGSAANGNIKVRANLLVKESAPTSPDAVGVCVASVHASGAVRADIWTNSAPFDSCHGYVIPQTGAAELRFISGTLQIAEPGDVSCNFVIRR